MAPLGHRAGSGGLLESKVKLGAQGPGLGRNFFDLERNPSSKNIRMDGHLFFSIV